METLTKKIQMVDLKTQYLNIKEEVDKGIQEVINNTAFINGPAVKEFQADLENYLQVKHVIPCANGTDALQIAMMALGLKQGDEVITAGGLLGKVTKVSDGYITVEVAAGTEVVMQKAAVTLLLPKGSIKAL